MWGKPSETGLATGGKQHELKHFHRQTESEFRIISWAVRDHHFRSSGARGGLRSHVPLITNYADNGTG